MRLSTPTRRNVIVVTAVVAIVAGVYLAQRGKQPEGGGTALAAGAAAKVRVATATTGDLSRDVELAGTVEPTRLARLSSPAEGPVTRLLLREGDSTRAGQLVLVIGRDRAASARLWADREELRKAKDELERVGRLVEKGALAGELLDKARADYERANAFVTAGEETTADYRILAPWAGLVAKVLVQEGNYVAPRTPLVEIFDPTSLVIRVALPEKVALSVRQGATAHVVFDAVAGKSFDAKVERLFPDLDRKFRTRTAELSLAGGPPLSPGMFARVRLVVETVTGAVIAPMSAVVTNSGGKQLVYSVEDDKAVGHGVVTGLEVDGRVQIVSGLAAGAEIVVAGHAKLKDGNPVTITRDGAGPKPVKAGDSTSSAPQREAGK